MPESKDVVILQLKIEEGTGKKIPEATKEVEVLSGSIVGLAKANKELRAERGKLDTQSAEGAKRIQELNKLIDKNNDIIKENSSNLEKQRLNVGNYQRGVTDALKEVRIGGINVGDVLDKLQKANEDLFQGMQAGFQKSGLAAKLFGNAARTALTLSGIGILIAGITLLIVHWNDITDAIGLTNNKSKEFFDAEEKRLADSATDLELRIKLMQLEGATIRETNFERRKQLEAELELNKAKLASAELDIKRATGTANLTLGLLNNIDEEKEKRDELTKTINNQLAQLKILSAEDKNEETAAKAAAKAIADAEAAKAESVQKAEQAKALAIKEKKDAELEALQETSELELLITQARTEATLAQSEKEITAIEKRIGAQIKARATEAKTEKERDAAKKAESALAKLVEEQKVAFASSALGQIGALFKEGSIAYKAFAIAQTYVDTYRAAAAALAPPPTGAGPIFGPIFAAIAIATGLANVAKINAIQFAQGGRADKQGTFSGPSHAGGGISYIRSDGKHRINVEGDENFYVLKKSASAEANYLSTLNQKHGGRSFGQKTWYAAHGGQIETRAAASRTNNIERTVRSVMQNLPPIVVTVEDINAKQSEVSDNTTKARVL